MRDRYGEKVGDDDAVSEWLGSNPEQRRELEHHARTRLGLRAGGEEASRVARIALDQEVAKLARRAMLSHTTASNCEHVSND